MDAKTTAAAIVAFLKDQQTTNAIQEDQRDSIDFAIEAITETYAVADNDLAQFQSHSLPELLSKALANTSSVPVHIDEAHSAPVDDDLQKKADALKLEGNQAIKDQDYSTAIEKYSQALELIPNNTIYLSNRAAAYTSQKDYENAIKDAQAATEIDSTFAKAWSRLGLAKYASGDYKGSVESYQKGLELEPTNDAMKKGLEGAKAKLENDIMSSLATDSPADNSGSAGASADPGGFDFSNLASMFGGAGAGAGAGGADPLGGLGGLLNNPQLMQAASEMMKNPDAIKNMMQNPQVQNMARSMGLDSSSMDSVLNNPNLADMAKNFMGGNNNNN